MLEVTAGPSALGSGREYRQWTSDHAFDFEDEEVGERADRHSGRMLLGVEPTASTSPKAIIALDKLIVMRKSKYWGTDPCKHCGMKVKWHKARGYCVKCYPVILMREEVARWNVGHRESVQPKAWLRPSEIDRMFSYGLGIFREAYLHQLDGRLELMASYKKRGVSGRDIEIRLKRLGEFSGLKRSDYYLAGVHEVLDRLSTKGRHDLFHRLSRLLAEQPFSLVTTLEMHQAMTRSYMLKLERDGLSVG